MDPALYFYRDNSAESSVCSDKSQTAKSKILKKKSKLTAMANISKDDMEAIAILEAAVDINCYAKHHLLVNENFDNPAKYGFSVLHHIKATNKPFDLKEAFNFVWNKTLLDHPARNNAWNQWCGNKHIVGALKYFMEIEMAHIPELRKKEFWIYKLIGGYCPHPATMLLLAGFKRTSLMADHYAGFEEFQKGLDKLSAKQIYEMLDKDYRVRHASHGGRFSFEDNDETSKLTRRSKRRATKPYDKPAEPVLREVIEIRKGPEYRSDEPFQGVFDCQKAMTIKETFRVFSKDPNQIFPERKEMTLYDAVKSQTRNDNLMTIGLTFMNEKFYEFAKTLEKIPLVDHEEKIKSFKKDFEDEVDLEMFLMENEIDEEERMRLLFAWLDAAITVSSSEERINYREKKMPWTFVAGFDLDNE